MPRSTGPPPLDLPTLLSDLHPIPQDDGPRPLAQIAYTDSYTEAMSYLRALMSANELSQRTLKLTEYIIAVNPAHYTCWGFRLRALLHVAKTQSLPAAAGGLGRGTAAGEPDGVAVVKNEEEEEGKKEQTKEQEDGKESEGAGELKWLQGEVEYLNRVALQHEKNYQIWHHRQMVMDRIGELIGGISSSEMKKTATSGLELNQKLKDVVKSEQAFTGKMFDLDSKNYHVWSYRQWLVRRFNLFSDPAELAAIESLLGKDVRNNSAWNHRFFLVFGSAVRPSEEVVKREVDYTQSSIYIAPQNPSPWNYLRGVFSQTGAPLSALLSFCLTFAPIIKPSQIPDPAPSSPPSSPQRQQRQTTVAIEEITSSHALDLLAEIYAEKAKLAKFGGVGGDKGEAEREESKLQAVKALELLAERYDPIRANYWDWRKREVLAV